MALASDWNNYKKHGDRSPKWDPLVEGGFAALDSKNQDAAVRFFQKAIKKGCNDGLVYLNLGLIFELDENLSRASEYILLAEKYLPTQYKDLDESKTIYGHVGRILYSTGNTEEAKVKLNKTMELNGESFTPLFLLGSIARRENNSSEVIYYYSKALNFPFPDRMNAAELKVTLLVEIATAYYYAGNYNDSLSAWEAVLQIAPGHPLAKKFKEDIKKREMMKMMEGGDEKMFERIIK